MIIRQLRARGWCTQAKAPGLLLPNLWFLPTAVWNYSVCMVARGQLHPLFWSVGGPHIRSESSDASEIPSNPDLNRHCHVDTAGERRAGQEVGPGEHKGDKQDDQGREVNEGEGKEGKGGACLDRVLLG